MVNQVLSWNASKGTTRQVLGNRVTFLVTGKETGGEFAVLLNEEKQGLGPPPHYHNHEVETFYVLEGAMTFLIENEIIHATPGTYVYVPKGVTHTFSVETEVAKVLVSVYPAGFDSFFQELSELLPDRLATDPNLPPSPDKIETLVSTAAKYGIHFPPPPQP